MTPAVWAAIGIAGATAIWGFLFWRLQRSTAKGDDLEKQVLHPEGALAKLRAEHAALAARVAGCVTTGDLDMSAAAVAEELRALRGENLEREERTRQDGLAREQRIVDAIVRTQATGSGAIDKLRDELKSSSGEFRREVGRIHSRIDTLRDRP